MPELISIPSNLVRVEANDRDADLFEEILDSFIQQGVEDADAIPFLKGQYHDEGNFTFYHLGNSMTTEGARCVFLGMNSEGGFPFCFFHTNYCLIYSNIKQPEHLQIINSLLNHFSNLKPLSFTYHEAPADNYIKPGVFISRKTWLDWFHKSAQYALDDWIAQKRSEINPVESQSAPASACLDTIELHFNTAYLKVPVEEIKTKTLMDLFAENAKKLDISLSQVYQITTQGSLVNPTSTPIPGNSYRAHYAPTFIG